MTTCEPSTLPLFDDSASSESMPSAADSPARTSASPARVPAWTVSAPDSGESFAVSLASFDPATCSWRMSGLFEGEDSLPFSEPFPRSGMVLSGTLFLLPPLVHLTSAIASGSSLLRTPGSAVIEAKSTVTKLTGRKPSDPQVGLADQLLAIEQGRMTLLPTPTTSDGGAWTPSHGTGQNLRAALLPTPTAQDSEHAGGAGCIARGKRGHSLTSAARLIPTPTAGDASASGSRNTATSKAHPGISLTDWAIGDGGTGRLLPTPQAEDHRNCADYSDGSRGKSPQLRHLGKGRLNPRFVEWMQGFPPGWTEL